MSIALTDAPPTEWTLASVQTMLSGFPADRIRTYPAAGMATEQDVLDAEARSGRLCELIDGVLVEKVMATIESALSAVVIQSIRNYLDDNNLGLVLGESGMLRILPGQVRIPDVSFIRWKRVPSGPNMPPIFPSAPDLAVEILSPSNTVAEMDRKLDEYFQSGVTLVWIIDPPTRTAKAYTSPHEWTEVGTNDSLFGGDVLPGFELALHRLFARIERPADQ